jgi:hypothetical protein
MTETIAAAAAALLNQYDGDNVWQDVIYDLADETLTDTIDNGSSDRFALADGTVIRFEPSLDRWLVADRTASEIAD